MATIVTRVTKGLPLTVTEHDANLTNLNDAIVAIEGNDLDARITTNANDIDTLQTDVVAAEVDIDALEVTDALNNAHRAAVTGNPHVVTKTEVGLGSVSNDAQLKVAGNDFPQFTAKTTPVSADLVLIEDSADSYNKKKIVLGGFTNTNGSDNVFVNGNFNIWQRGTSFSAAVNGMISTDCWRYFKSGAGAHDIAQTTDAPNYAESNVYSPYALQLVSTVASANAAGDFCMLANRIEGYDLQALMGGDITLSFWVKSSVVGTYCITFTNASDLRSHIKEYTINTADTWEKKSVSITLDEATGTWDSTNGMGLSVYFVLQCGSTYQSTADSWLSASVYATSNQVNGVPSVSKYFKLSQVKLEAGSTATAFKDDLIATAMMRAQRYHQIVPFSTSAYTLAGSAIVAATAFPTFMRAVPSGVETDAVYFAASNCGTSSTLMLRADGAAVYRIATVAGGTQFSCSLALTASL